MKNLIAFLMMSVMVTATFAQQKPEPSYKIKDGLIHVTLYHQNGEIAQTGQYTHDGKLQGEWISFNEKGDLISEGNYYYGKKSGTWKFYKGDVKQEVLYINNKITSIRDWDKLDNRVVSNN